MNESTWRIEEVEILEDGKYFYISVVHHGTPQRFSMCLSVDEFRDFFFFRKTMHSIDFELGQRLEGLSIELSKMEFTLDEIVGELNDSNKS